MPPFKYRVECIITEIDENDEPVDAGREDSLDFILSTIQSPVTFLRNILRNTPDDVTVSEITT